MVILGWKAVSYERGTLVSRCGRRSGDGGAERLQEDPAREHLPGHLPHGHRVLPPRPPRAGAQASAFTVQLNSAAAQRSAFRVQGLATICSGFSSTLPHKDIEPFLRDLREQVRSLLASGSSGGFAEEDRSPQHVRAYISS